MIILILERCATIKLTPITSKHAKGVDYGLHFNAQSDNMVSTDIKKVLRPNLQKFVDTLRTKEQKYATLLIEANAEIEKYNVEKNALRYKLDELKMNISKLNQTREKKKVEYDTQLEAAKSNIEQVQKEIDNISSSTQQELEDRYHMLVNSS